MGKITTPSLSITLKTYVIHRKREPPIRSTPATKPTTAQSSNRRLGVYDLHPGGIREGMQLREALA
jgi:hypothetical protein